MDPEEVRREVKVTVQRASRTAPKRPETPPGDALPGMPEPKPGLPVPDPRDRRLEAERGTLRLIVRAPGTFDASWNGLGVDDFTHPAYRALFASVLTAGDGPGSWTQRILDAHPDPVLEQLVVALAVEPVLREPTESYAREYSAQLRVQSLARSIADLKSKLQRTNPVEDQGGYNRMFATLLDLEKQRRELTEVAAGPAD